MPPSIPEAVDHDQAGPRPSKARTRWLIRLLVGFTLLLGLAGLTLRFWVWPQFAQLLNDEARLLALAEPGLSEHGLRLSVRGARAEWEGWFAPRLTLEDATLTDSDQQTVLQIQGLQAVFGLRSLLSLLDQQPVFSRLEIARLQLESGRDASGRLQIAGFPLGDGPADPRLFQTLSQQGVFRLGELTLAWRDRSQPGTEAALLRLQDLALRVTPSLVALRAASLDLQALSEFQRIARPALGRLELGGQLSAVSVDWSGSVAEMGSLRFTDVLRGLSLEAQLASVSARVAPSFMLEGLSGQIRLADGSGRLQVDDGPAALTMPELFAAGPLAFDRVRGLLEWTVSDWSPDASGLPSGLQVDLQSAEIENADLLLRAKASQSVAGGRLGPTSIRGTVDRLIPSRAHAYLPSIVGRDAREWIARAFVKAKPASGDFQVSGQLADFPFPEGSDGRFEANLRVEGLDLRFARGWPLIQEASVDLAFRGPSLQLSSQSARFGQVAISRIEGLIPDLDAQAPFLDLQAGLDAPLMDMVKTVNQSPVKAMLANLTEGARATGQATLGLDLRVDLNDPDDSLVKGQLRLTRNQLALEGGIPEMRDLHGEIGFSESGLTALAVDGQSLGGPLRIVQSPGRSTRLTATGQFQGAALEAWLRASASLPLKGALVGESAYELTLEMARRSLSLDLRSSLKGLAIRLPAPARKSAQSDWGLHLRMMQTPKPGGSRLQQWRLETQGNRLSGLLEQTQMAGGSGDLKGSFALGEPAAPPTRSGIVLSMISPSLHLARWLSALDRRLEIGGADAAGDPARPGLARVEIKSPELLVGAQRVTSVTAQATQTAGVWSIDLRSDQVAGRLVWRGGSGQQSESGPSKGVLVARLSRLWLSRENGSPPLSKPVAARAVSPAASANGGANAATNGATNGGSDDEDGFQPLPVTALSEARGWPSIDLVAEDFRRGSSRFGQLTLDAAPSQTEPGWIIRQLRVQGPSARLEASGRWAARAPGLAESPSGMSKASPPSETSLEVNLQVASGQGLLDQMGFGGLIKGTPGQVRGQLAWDGAPTDFRPQALRGQLSLDLGEGQFLKADPGLAKLISVLNLQSLPSRISLDFRDIFSDGFAYQRVRGDVRFERGLAQTSNLRIVGIQASVFIDGEASLPRETQNIRVLVLPELNAGLASLGYALVNPAIGLGSFLAQYVLRDPLRKVLAYEYRVSGPWVDPVVTELPRRAPPEMTAPQ